MSQSIDEQLSAMLDGELPEEQEELLLRRLERSDEHLATLVRYSVIGELVRGSAPRFDADAALARVRAAVDEESDDGAGMPVPTRQSSWGFSLAGAGLAAAAALVAVLSFNQPGDAIGEPGAIPVAAVSQPAPARLRTVATRSRGPAIAPQRLTGYLVSHGDYAGGLSRQVVNSHVVNSTPGFRTAEFRRVSTGD
ncbi:MAG: RseA family anti-sigma factor [Gammaproteobacteria bacterium]|nr:RseA family anti-sigma factor [Gammaproteobacteria bacterium]